MKDGRNATKPYSAVLSVIRITLPVIVRASIARENRSARRPVPGAGIDSGGLVTSGSLRPVDFSTSASIALSTFSASSERPCDSSQRGDSGIRLRRNQTTRAPTPTITNIQRQPYVGITARPTTADTNREELVQTARPAPHRPRLAGGMNSESVT